jgi:hypothetical protein
MIPGFGFDDPLRKSLDLSVNAIMSRLAVTQRVAGIR